MCSYVPYVFKKPLFKKNSVVKDFPYICLNLKSKYTYDYL